MNQVKVMIEDEVVEKFRKAAMRRFGYAKGSLSKAAQTAFSQWANQEDAIVKEVHAIGDPIQAVSGMLSKVKKSSVELQHEIGRIWGKDHARN